MLKSRVTKIATIAVAALSIVVLAALPSFAAADTAAVTAVTTASEGLKDTLVAVATAVLPYAAAILAIGIGWRLARKFVRG
jgi:hypothetical protein